MCAAPDRLRALAGKFSVEVGVERDSQGVPVPEDEEERPTIVPYSGVGFCFGESVDAGQGTLFVTAKWVLFESA